MVSRYAAAPPVPSRQPGGADIRRWPRPGSGFAGHALTAPVPERSGSAENAAAIERVFGD